MRKLIIFGTYHEVTGLKNFRKNVVDPDYKIILEALLQVHGVDFIFEEASGHGPSVASELVIDRYLDIDSETTEEALSRFSEDSDTVFLPEILRKSGLQEPARKLGLSVQDWRERCWVTKIRDQQFTTGLVICGKLHSLSIAFRLQAEGFDVETYYYEPIERIVAGWE